MNRLRPSSDLAQARRAFFERGTTPAVDLPQTILRSWQRCRRLGVPDAPAPAIDPVPEARLREMRERNERLRRIARAEMALLAGDAEASGSIVLLTDDAGWILDAAGHPRFLDKAGRVALRPGACWDEAQVGTNAIGTAIVERRAVEVRGSEHYRAPHGILTCTATPIHDPWGRLVGVLDISSDARSQPSHALGLVRMAVAQIEHRYFDGGLDDCELLRLHRDPALLGSAQEGILAFRSGRLVAANQTGLELIGLGREDIGRAAYDALFDEPLSRLRRDGAIRDRSGRSLHGRIDGARATGTASGTPAPARPAPARTVPSARARRQPSPLFDAQAEAMLERARRVLDAELPVLIVGETGSGKDVFARALHARCTRAERPFVAVNCAALPEGLIESELFGYEEGAFTGARRQGSPGLLRQAEGGVLFLDEIGDMPLSLQPRLLRVLQERELSPLGGGRPIRLDIALVCATHCDLDRAVASGRFRADLFYRIAQHRVRLPALRVGMDLRGTIERLWAEIAGDRCLEADALDALAACAWPGNWRQLVACLRTLVALSDDGERIGVDALPDEVRADMQKDMWADIGTMDATAFPALGEVHPDARPGAHPRVGRLESMQDAAMRSAMAAAGGNVAHAARLLGISRSTLYRRLGAPARGGGTRSGSH